MVAKFIDNIARPHNRISHSHVLQAVIVVEYCYKSLSVGVYGVNSPSHRIMENEGLFRNVQEN
ncbi:hypothetical protein AVEN_78631-1, partial [Araneus ventricosus]